MPLVKYLPDALRRPKEESELIQSQRMGQVSPVALSIPYCIGYADLPYPLPRPVTRQYHHFRIFGKWLLDRRRINAEVLIGFREVDGFPDCVLEEVPILTQSVILHCLFPRMKRGMW